MGDFKDVPGKWTARELDEDKWGQEWRNVRATVYASTESIRYDDVAAVFQREMTRPGSIGKGFVISGTHGDGERCGIRQSDLLEETFAQADLDLDTMIMEHFKGKIDFPRGCRPFVFDVGNGVDPEKELVAAIKKQMPDFIVKAWCSSFEGCPTVDRCIREAYQS